MNLREVASGWPNLPTAYDSKTAELELLRNLPVVIHSMVLLAEIQQT